jgi:hypothetical protein
MAGENQFSFNFINSVAATGRQRYGSMRQKPCEARSAAA